MAHLDLADLLTASGAAVGVSNRRLAETGEPALLKEFTLELTFDAAFKVPDGACTVLLKRVSMPNAQMQVLTKGSSGNVTVTARYIAAPSLKTGPGAPAHRQEGGDC